MLLDIKTLDAVLYKHLTGAHIDKPLAFLNHLEEIGKDTWIRHAIVPGLTNDKKKLEKLADYLTKLSVIKKVELLGCQHMGISKYKKLGIEYALKDTKALSAE